jgi:hypothetical protein
MELLLELVMRPGLQPLRPRQEPATLEQPAPSVRVNLMTPRELLQANLLGAAD